MPTHPTRRNCGAQIEHRRLLNEDPNYVAARSRIETFAREFAASRRAEAREGVTRIPVVVHILWHTAGQNISDEQVHTQIDVLNQDYRARNADLSNVPSVWQSLATDARVEFQLATTDPAGNATTGITRTQTSVEEFPQDGNRMKFTSSGGHDAWPAASYLNIWVCQLGDGLLGYAQFPGGPAETDGVVILHSGFGTTGTAAAPFNKGRTATHEIGHWLNLFHIWGDDGTGCNGTDEVADTPNAAGPNFGCPTFPHVTCSNGPNGDMFMNYMDYTDDACMFMFTQGQAVRMQATLDGVRSSVGTPVVPVNVTYVPADLTGDGRPDVLGFGDAGVWVSLNTGNGTFGPVHQVLNNFAYAAGGWRVEKHPRFLADLTGDGRADIVGFGEAGVWVSMNKGDGNFLPLERVVDDFGYTAGGWRVEKHPRFLADLTGDGRADIIGFGENRVWVSLNKGNGTFGPVQQVLSNFTYGTDGWRVEKHPRFLADLTGDGRADIVGFGEAGVWVALNNGNGTFQQPTLAIPDFGYTAGGWRVDKHPRFVADLTGDGRADIIGFGENRVWVSLNQGNGTFGPVQQVLSNFTYGTDGWRVDRHPRFLADLTLDGKPDIVGFGEAGVWVALNNGHGTFQPPKLALGNFGYAAGGWRMDKHPRFLADLTGDGRADIAGFGNDGMWTSLNHPGVTFAALQLAIADFGYVAGGWRVEKHPRVVASKGAVGQ